MKFEEALALMRKGFRLSCEFDEGAYYYATEDFVYICRDPSDDMNARVNSFNSMALLSDCWHLYEDPANQKFLTEIEESLNKREQTSDFPHQCYSQFKAVSELYRAIQEQEQRVNKIEESIQEIASDQNRLRDFMSNMLGLKNDVRKT